MIRCFAFAACAALLAGVAPATASITALYDFEGVAAGSAANTLPASALGERFLFGAFLPDQDQFGDDIPGSERWRVDPLAPDVTIENSLDLWRGPAPSGVNMLDARFQPVLVTFPVAVNIDPAGFSVTLDNDTFGSDGTTGGFGDIEVAFYDPSGTLILEIATNQTIPGLIVASGSLSNVGFIYLAGGALYDDLRITGDVIPGPSALALGSITLLAALRRRR